MRACGQTCGFPIRAERSGLRNWDGKEMARGACQVVGHLDLPSSTSFDVIDVERQRVRDDHGIVATERSTKII